MFVEFVVILVMFDLVLLLLLVEFVFEMIELVFVIVSKLELVCFVEVVVDLMVKLKDGVL